MTPFGWMASWRLGIGDPDMVGWFTLAAYLASAALCRRARSVAIRRVEEGEGGGSNRMWGVLALGLGALGLNKQMDLQSTLTEAGRAIVHELGWYQDRRILQVGFVALVVVVAVALCVWLALLARPELPRVLLALIGWVGLCAFVALRAASFHHLDRVLGTRWGGARMNVIWEASGIALIALGAIRYRRPPV